jgi:hypothetical protein
VPHVGDLVAVSGTIPQKSNNDNDKAADTPPQNDLVVTKLDMVRDTCMQEESIRLSISGTRVQDFAGGGRQGKRKAGPPIRVYTHSADRPYFGRITGNPSIIQLGKAADHPSETWIVIRANHFLSSDCFTQSEPGSGR